MGYYKGDYRICYIDDKYIFSVFLQTSHMFELSKDVLEAIQMTSIPCTAKEFEMAWDMSNPDEDETFLYYQSKRKFNH